MESKFLEQLNDSQRAAVEYCDGSQLVIAGAGSGKTRVLTYKIAYLLEQGFEPWRILALTFTNKAAREMKERIGLLVGEDRARYLRMGTFHSIFARILRAELSAIGYAPNFTIYDEKDSQSLLKTIIKDLQLDEKQYRPSAVHGRISMAKNHLTTPDEYLIDKEIQLSDMRARLPETGHIYKVYQSRLQNANAMDFDDLLFLTHRLFKENPQIRDKYAEQFKYILVDEYQDTNFAQQRIVSMLSKAHNRVCVVGDDAQSIYSFRGANIDNILHFQKQYGDAQLFKLERNYRSTRNIVLAANSLIKHNERQIPKDVYSKNEEGSTVRIREAYSDREEAAIVCNEIKGMCRRGKGAYSDFVILYRTHAQSRSFEDEFRSKSVPYRIYGGLSFYQRKEIKDVIAYFRVVVNPHDEEALKRIINYPARGIGGKTLERIATAARERGVSLWTVLQDAEHSLTDVNRGTLAKLAAFRDMVSECMKSLSTSDAYELGGYIMEVSGIAYEMGMDLGDFSFRPQTSLVQAPNEPRLSPKRASFKPQTSLVQASNEKPTNLIRKPQEIPDAETQARQENLREFMSGLREFVEGRREAGEEGAAGLADFLSEVSLLTDQDNDGDANEPKVTLMTIHSAKGLEFPTVFVVGMEENIFPSQMALGTPRAIEEERRLLYVAITRAKEHCILTYARNRWQYGNITMNRPSRFLDEIDRRFVSREDEPRSTASGSGYETDRGFSRTPRASYNMPQDMLERIRRKPSITRTESPRGSFRRLTDIGQKTAAPSSEGSAPLGGIRVGMVIEHPRFGIGEVTDVVGTGENTKATVLFKNVGTKQLLVKFARFKVVE